MNVEERFRKAQDELRRRALTGPEAGSAVPLGVRRGCEATYAGTYDDLARKTGLPRLREKYRRP